MKQLSDELKEMFFEYGVEPHWCKQKECEASRVTDQFFEALTQYIDSQTREARDTTFTLTAHALMNYFRKLFTYEILYGKIVDMDNRDVAKELERYQELEPERMKFADWYAAQIKELKDKD